MSLAAKTSFLRRCTSHVIPFFGRKQIIFAVFYTTYYSTLYIECGHSKNGMSCTIGDTKERCKNQNYYDMVVITLLVAAVAFIVVHTSHTRHGADAMFPATHIHEHFPAALETVRAHERPLTLSTTHRANR